MAKSFKDLPAAAQAVILIAAGLALPILVFFFGIPYVLDAVYPKFEQKAKLESDYKALKAKNDRNEVFRLQNAEIQIQIRDLERQLATLRLLVPDDPAQDQFVRLVYETGAGQGVNIRTFIAGAPIQKDFYFEAPYSARLDGTYHALVNFFDRLRTVTRIVSVTSISLGSPQGGGLGAYVIHPNETVGANCTLSTYYNAPAGAPPPPPAKR